MQYTYIALFLLLIVLFAQKQHQKIVIKKIVTSKNRKDKKEMVELAKRFIDKECIVYTYDSQVHGFIKEVSSGALLVEREGNTEAVNIDFVVRIREYPRRKNGKKKSVVID